MSEEAAVSSEKPQQKSRPAHLWKPGQSGNPAGKPVGARHRSAQLAQKLIDEGAEDVITTVVANAKKGDPVCQRLVIERILPPRKYAPIKFDLPKIRNIEDAKAAVTHILEAQCAGELTAEEAEGLLKTVDTYVKVHQLTDLEDRISKLEIVRTIVDVTRNETAD